MNKAHNKKCAPGIMSILRKMGPHFVCCSSQIFVKFNLHCDAAALLIRLFYGSEDIRKLLMTIRDNFMREE